MMLHDPEAFAAVAREWAIKHAGAPIGILGASQGMSSHDRGNARDATAEGHRSPKKVDDLAQYVLPCNTRAKRQGLTCQVSRL